MKRFFQLGLFAILSLVMAASFGVRKPMMPLTQVTPAVSAPVVPAPATQSSIGSIVLGFPKTTSRFCDKQQSRFIMTASKGFTLKALKNNSSGQNIHGVVANVKPGTPDEFRSDQVNVYGPKDQKGAVDIVIMPLIGGTVPFTQTTTHCTATLKNSKWTYDCGGDFKGEVDMPTLGFFFDLASC